MIKWDDKYSVGISMIDEEHKKLISIFNKAVSAKEHNDNPEEIKEILSGLIGTAPVLLNRHYFWFY
jgi:hemerythrin